MNPTLDKILFRIVAAIMWAILIAAFALAWAFWPSAAQAGSLPDEPSLIYKTGWEPKPSGVVVIEYVPPGGVTVYYAHSIQQTRPAKHWKRARVEGGILYLTTIEAAPTTYEVSAEPIKFRYAYQPEFIDVTQKTSCPITCE